MFTNPLKNLKSFGLREDSVVADLGAGTGFYSLALGHMLPKGKIYAVELMKDFLATIKSKAKDEHLHNIDIIWGNVERLGGTKIADAVVDAVIASNIFSQLEDKNKFIEEIKRILKDKGRVLFIDWLASYFKGSKVFLSKEKIIEMFNEKGLVLDREIDAGEHHYGIIFIKN